MDVLLIGVALISEEEAFNAKRPFLRHSGLHTDIGDPAVSLSSHMGPAQVHASWRRDLPFWPRHVHRREPERPAYPLTMLYDPSHSKIIPQHLARIRYIPALQRLFNISTADDLSLVPFLFYDDQLIIILPGIGGQRVDVSALFVAEAEIRPYHYIVRAKDAFYHISYKGLGRKLTELLRKRAGDKAVCFSFQVEPPLLPRRQHSLPLHIESAHNAFHILFFRQLLYFIYKRPVAAVQPVELPERDRARPISRIALQTFYILHSVNPSSPYRTSSRSRIPSFPAGIHKYR